MRTAIRSLRELACAFAATAMLAAVAALAGCATPPAAPVDEVLPFEQAIAVAAAALASQTQTLPSFLARLESRSAGRGVVLDPMLDSATGQQTAATTLLQEHVVERLSAPPGAFEILPFRAASLGRAQYLLTGTMARVPGERARPVLQINLALTDLPSGNVVAQASARARADELDMSPLPYYRDSPVLLKDDVIEGYIRTSATAAGQPADAFYLQRIAAAALISDATALYNEARYSQALGQYRSALAAPTGEQLRIVNGIYLASEKLGHRAEAEQAFGRVVALGIAYRQLGVKFLFNPGNIEFWSDPKISAPYAMWLRRIARESLQAKACMEIVGHTSRTGSEQANDALSLQRAVFIRQRLIAEAAALGPRSRAIGMGMRENIVGSGTDNALDALDRRVEFKIVSCD